jgi:DNA-binding response OmpR family regulator
MPERPTERAGRRDDLGSGRGHRSGVYSGEGWMQYMALDRSTLPRADSGAPILVVEDDLDVQRVIQWALEDAGLTVETAADGWHALALALMRQPALVVLDLRLPRLDGDDVVAGLQMAHKARIPVVIVSADRAVAARAHELGAIAYLSKPFDLDALLDAVRRGLSNTGL